jgi:hypothetical protein
VRCQLILPAAPTRCIASNPSAAQHQPNIAGPSLEGGAFSSGDGATLNGQSNAVSRNVATAPNHSAAQHQPNFAGPSSEGGPLLRVVLSLR